MSTIQEVAKLAGVATGTVSRYLNGMNMREANRAKIEAAIKTLGYRPNYAAKSLRNNQTMLVGMLMNNMYNLLAAGLVARMENEMEKYGYVTAISGFRYDPKLFESRLDALLAHRVDALVVFEADSSWPGTATLRNLDIPVIAVGSPLDFPNVDSVLIDDRASSREAVSQLIAQADARFGIIGAHQESYASRERLAGALEAIDAAGLPRNQVPVYLGDYSRQDGCELARRLICEDGAHSIFCTNYGMSLGVLDTLVELGLEPGHDIAFTCYSYLDPGTVSRPSIKTICPPLDEVGRAVSNLVIERLQKTAPGEVQRILLQNVFNG